MGALCLNQAGLDQLTSRPNIIPKIVAVLTSERHHKALQEKENATQLGAYIDELVRHHPILREPLLKAVIDTLNELKTLGSAERSDDETVYHILPAALPSTVAPAESSSSSMEVSSSSASTSAPVDSEPSTSTAPSSITVAPAPVPPPLQSARSQDAEQPDGYVDNDVVLKIGRLARVRLSSFCSK
jgi:E3 ubiquitin-protein ligase HUWE1